MSLYVAKLLTPVRRQLNWGRPRLSYFRDTRYSLAVSLRSIFIRG